MRFEEETSDLLALLMAHTRGSSPAMVVVPQPPTLAPACVSSTDAVDKKRKRAQGGKSTKGAEEGEVTQSFHQPPAKEAQTGRGKQKKNTSFGTSKELGGPKPFVWRPLFTFSTGSPELDDANLRDHQKGSSGLVAECLEKALCLLEDMQELGSFKKREVFLSLK